MKRKALCLYMALISLLCACSGPAYGSLDEAEAGGARLGENISIDGVNVSGLAPSEAAARLEEAHKAALAGLRYQVRAGDETLEISGGSLPIRFNTEEVLLKALALPAHAPSRNARTLACAPYVELEPLRAALSEQTAGLNQEPQDAVATYDPTVAGHFVFTEATPGRAVDVHGLAQALQKAVEAGDDAPLPANFTQIPPAYTAQQAQADNQLIAEFSTSFAGGTYGKKDRVFNVQKAAGLIDGTVLAPGKEFNMNETLGDRNAENGWKKAAGIREGAYVQEYGGGVCQVSTTLYNAVLMADLAVTERHHHSWPLGYIDAGRDATISTDGPNFCFVNSSDAPVTLGAVADTEAKTITVRIYGRPLEGGVTIAVKSKKTATLNDLGTEYTVDRSLPPGATKEVRKSRRGCIAVTWKEYYDADGKLLKEEQVSEDKYRSIRGLVKVSS